MILNRINKEFVSKMNKHMKKHNISVKNNIGIEDLINSIVKHLKSLAPKEDILLTRKNDLAYKIITIYTIIFCVHLYVKKTN